MSKTTKKWLATATALVFVGLILFLVAAAANKWDLTAFGTREYETNTYDVTEDFTDIAIKTDTANVCVLPSEDGKCKVVAFEDAKQKHTVTVDGDVLTVSITDNRAWYEFIGFSFTSPKITVYLPHTVYGSLLVKTDTGDVEIPKDFGFEEVNVTTSTGDVKLLSSVSGNVNITASTGNVRLLSSVSGGVKIATSTGSVTLDGASAESVEVSTSTGNILLSSVSITGDLKTEVSTGDTRLTDVTARTMTTEGDTGDLYLTRVRITEDLSVKRSTGDVVFDRSDAESILVETDTGDVTGTLLTKKLFLTETETGDVSVPRSESGGRCEITTSTGDINIRIQE